MRLTAPFIIGARLAPALPIGAAYLSFDDNGFVLDFPDGTEHRITDFRFPACRIAGQTDADRLQAGFSAVCSFLSACAESRVYKRHYGGNGENADLFPERVGQWAEENNDAITILSIELEETPGLITDNNTSEATR